MLLPLPAASTPTRPLEHPADEDEPAAADTVSGLRVILYKRDPLSTEQTRTLLDEEAFNLLNRVGRRDGELERASERSSARQS